MAVRFAYYVLQEATGSIEACVLHTDPTRIAADQVESIVTFRAVKPDEHHVYLSSSPLTLDRSVIVSLSGRVMEDERRDVRLGETHQSGVISA